MTDWKALPEGTVEVQMVSWHDLDAVLGILEGVDLSASSLSASYTTDTRASGRLRVAGEGWIRKSLLRIIARFGEESYELGTYCVPSIRPTLECGEWFYDMELQSRLYTLGKDRSAGDLFLPAGSSVIDMIAKDLGVYAGYPCSVDGNDLTVQENYAIEAGTSRIEQVYELCELSGNRCDVDGHGVITVRPYVPASQRPAAFELDLDDPRGIVDGGVERESDYLSLPNRVAVEYTVSGGDGQSSVYGWADAEGPDSPSACGYVITDYRTVDDLPEPTAAAAFQRARELLPEIGETVEWKLSCAFLPIWEGDVVDLVVNSGEERYRGRRHCLVKDVDIDLQFLTMHLTLREGDLR